MSVIVVYWCIYRFCYYLFDKNIFRLTYVIIGCCFFFLVVGSIFTFAHINGPTQDEITKKRIERNKALDSLIGRTIIRINDSNRLEIETEDGGKINVRGYKGITTTFQKAGE